MKNQHTWKYVYNPIRNAIVCVDQETGAWFRVHERVPENQVILEDNRYVYLYRTPHDRPAELLKIDIDKMTTVLPMHIEPQTS